MTTDADFETAIAIRNTRWSEYQMARARLAEARATERANLRPEIHDYNRAQDRYEEAARELVRQRVAWRLDHGRDWRGRLIESAA